MKKDFEELRKDFVTESHPEPEREGSWLVRGEEVEVIHVDSEENPYLLTGPYEGIAVPDGGGPVELVFREEGKEIRLDSDAVVGMTKIG